MSITTRLRIVLVILVTAIVLVIGVWAFYSLRNASAVVIRQSETGVTELRSELADLQQRALGQLLLALIGVGLMVAFGASYLAEQLIKPVRRLAEATTRVTAGDHLPIDIEERSDEIGDLARAFNSTTVQLNDLVTRLEERTKDLGQRAEELEESNRRSQRRAAQLKASAQVARAVASTLDPDRLLDQVVRIISDHFGHYHTAVFLVDEAGRWAVLRATNSEGGQRLLARGHRLAVGVHGIVGTVIRTGQPRVAHKVHADAVYFAIPELPDTRSEMALPLVARGQVLGALDVQSTEEAAFDEDDVAVLSILADQIAIALDNARLYDASQTALAYAQVAQQEYASEVWRQSTTQRVSDFFEYRQSALAVADNEPVSAAEKVLNEGVTTATSGQNGQPAALVAPIKVRGTVIGALGLQESDSDGGRVWSDDDIALVETVADQVAQAMETARLYHQAQQRAQREQSVTAIASKIRSASDIDDIMRTAVREIRRSLGTSYGAIRLGTESHLKPPDVRHKGPMAEGDGDSRDE